MLVVSLVYVGCMLVLCWCYAEFMVYVIADFLGFYYGFMCGLGWVYVGFMLAVWCAYAMCCVIVCFPRVYDGFRLV